MASSKKQSVDLIARGLEADVNKKTSVSIFDRFGGKSPLFKKQFEDTKLSLKRYNSVKQRSGIQSSLNLLDDTLESKSRELHLLSSFNKSKITRLEKICEAVTELREDFDFEIDNLKTVEDEPTTRGDSEPDDIADTIMEWKTDMLPSVPIGPPGRSV
ncbi:hypothetical protein [Rhinolophus gammaherpesvirus 1]|uniref:Tegument protein UL14 n=1 Tax=Rhinolophus gammaherpesvirus 1 TaxID=2054179 RepID=A0A2Z5U6B8_9GAMA|nr:hypothetical protein [Rhinolophus gammaherpesvirus 1]BBB06484.1 hypothetical protein [Rhinolophus gammaherpesvirus 1]